MLAPSMRRVVAAFAPRLRACSPRPMVSDIRRNLHSSYDDHRMHTGTGRPSPRTPAIAMRPLQSQLHVSAAGQQAIP